MEEREGSAKVKKTEEEALAAARMAEKAAEVKLEGKRSGIVLHSCCEGSFSTLPVTKLKQLPDDVTGSKKSSKLALPLIEETGEHRDVVPLPKVKVVKRLDPGKDIFAKKGAEDINSKGTVKLEKEVHRIEELQVKKEEHRMDVTEGRRGLSEPQGIAVSTPNSSFPADKISRLDKSEDSSSRNFRGEIFKP